MPWGLWTHPEGVSVCTVPPDWMLCCLQTEFWRENLARPVNWWFFILSVYLPPLLTTSGRKDYPNLLWKQEHKCANNLHHWNSTTWGSGTLALVQRFKSYRIVDTWSVTSEICDEKGTLRDSIPSKIYSCHCLPVLAHFVILCSCPKTPEASSTLMNNYLFGSQFSQLDSQNCMALSLTELFLVS